MNWSGFGKYSSKWWIAYVNLITLMKQNAVKGDRYMTTNEMLSQLFAIYNGNFLMTKTILLLLIYELALNHEIQQKLYQELNESIVIIMK